MTVRTTATMSSPRSQRKQFTLFPMRFAIATMGALGLIFQYIIKVTLSVAIGGMVTHVPEEAAALETCPRTDNGNTSSSTEQGGVFEWDETMQGYILSSYYYGYAGINIIAGYTASRFSARWVFGTGMLLTGVFTVLGPVCAQAGAVVFMITRIIVGTSSGVILPTMHVLFARWFPENERQKLGGSFFSANYLGTVISMSLSGTIVKNLGWYSVFYIFGGITIFLMIPFLYFVYDFPEMHPRITEEEKKFLLANTGRDLIGTEEKPELRHKDEFILNPWPLILTSPAMWVHCAMTAGGAWVNYTLMTELPTYMQNILHYDIAEAGLISALPYLFGWISCGVFSFVSQKIVDRGLNLFTSMKIWNGIACIGPTLTLLGVTLVNCDVTLLITLFVLTMVLRCAVYGGSYLNHLYLFPRAYGSAAGLTLTMGNITGILTPMVTSAFVAGRETVQQWKYVFYVAMTISLLPYFAFITLGSIDEEETKWVERRERRKKKQQVEP